MPPHHPHPGAESAGRPGPAGLWRAPLRQGWLWWLPLVAVAADIVAELAIHGKEPVSFLLIAVPPITAATRGPRGTALSAVVCLGLQFWMAARRPGHFAEQHHIALYVSTLLIGIASTVQAWQRERTEQHLTRAHSVAAAMQRALLRPVPYRLGRVRAVGYYEAGEGGTLVGGDLYDVCETPFGVRAIIGDVRGKGLDAVQTVAAVLGNFRVSAHEWSSLGRLTQRLELSITRNSPSGNVEDPELFVTALVVEIPDSGDVVEIVDRGHPPPLVIGPGGVRQLATVPALPLGLGALCPESIRTTVHPLSPGEVLVVHTDGLSEARDASGAFYPIADRLEDRFRGHGRPEPEAVVSFLRADVARWSAAPDDDDQAVLAIVLGRADSTS
ncbi:PP2C family protein-serine/threonine phosphatase [Streptomyces sp. NPDC020800]|uniref:PP2C family protein-serine/threonine phosphatase n=1 Tax=Streptomyces sp. NPDC020800 TaxID=3365092 RepID=UPI0037B1716B